MKPLVLRNARELPLWAISSASTLYNRTGSWRNFRPVYQNKTPPCNQACPTGEKIQGYIDLVNSKQYRRAWELIKEDNPLPAVCGRVCFHPCESECNRNSYDESVAIHCIERFIGDYGLNKGLKVRRKKVSQNRKVAIIGGGPAGLSCAYHLAYRGIRPTIFEATSQLGGMLRHGIPSYRLPKYILKKEIDSIVRLGVDVRTKTRVGADVSLEKIYKAYDAVFIGTGALKERRLNIPGEDSKGVMPALDLLHSQNAGKKVRLGKRVAIVGGGNAAIDAARSVLRQGSKPFLVYRRTSHEMPAMPDEIRDAEEERIEFVFLAAPVRIITKQGKVTGLECVRMKLGKPDASGRRTPIPIKGSKLIIKVDTVIPAIGEEPDLSFLPASIKISREVVDINASGATNRRGIFAGGDAVTGPRTVAEAIGAGKKAAIGILAYLKVAKAKSIDQADNQVVRFEELNLNYFGRAPRVHPFKFASNERSKGFKEVYYDYREKELLQEGSRCFSCGVCDQCDNCFVFCPDMSVSKKNGHYEFNYDYCKGCGICVSECPRGAISLIEENR